jgi:predicted HNH restriction endonuclease
LNEGKFNYDIHYHHIISLNEANDLKYSVNNLVPLCPRHHSEIESKVRANKEQPNWKEVRKLVEDELRSLGKIGD